ncbi:MAG: hypothetical protein F6J98_02340 [Moorea sp. SIO4G2]|nr:hypothetical protein [Moorena sp. SIO4G2]
MEELFNLHSISDSNFYRNVEKNTEVIVSLIEMFQRHLDSSVSNYLASEDEGNEDDHEYIEDVKHLSKVNTVVAYSEIDTDQLTVQVLRWLARFNEDYDETLSIYLDSVADKLHNILNYTKSYIKSDRSMVPPDQFFKSLEIYRTGGIVEESA